MHRKCFHKNNKKQRNRHQTPEKSTTRLPKNLKGFANKRQGKHTSTFLEPSIPFHTIVELVDAEDITNDKTRTHDLTLEVNKITKQLQTKTLDSSQQEQLMFTQPRDPNNKKKTAQEILLLLSQKKSFHLSFCQEKRR